MSSEQIATLRTAESIARDAGSLIKEGFEKEKPYRLKGSAIDLVTEYDHAAEALIRKRLNAHFPDHRIIGEEEGADPGESEHVWYVDPIDGTTNFAHGVPHFSVSIAMYTAGTPSIGVVFNPMLDELFSGAHGYGATLCGSDGIRRSLRVSKTAEINQALLGTGFPYDRGSSDIDNLAQVNRVVKRCRGLRRQGSAALDMAYVAAGRLDGYWEFKLGCYDIAAGVVLVREAGGVVRHLENGGPFEMADVVNIMATGPNLEDGLLDLLKTPVFHY